MATVNELSATARPKAGKGAARAVRREGRVPAVIYGDSKEPLGISLDFKARKVWFQLRKCKPEGIIISTSPDNFSRLSSTATQDVCGR